MSTDNWVYHITNCPICNMPYIIWNSSVKYQGICPKCRKEAKKIEKDIKSNKEKTNG